MPFVIVGVVVLHVAALHVTGSNNPDGIDKKGPQDSVPFNPYFTAKDSVGLGVFLLVKAVVFHAEVGFMTAVVDGPVVQVPMLAVLAGYVLLLVQMLRGVTAALGCGGLLGLLLALAGIGLVLGGGVDGSTDFDAALFLAMAAAGLALALGASLRLLSRRAP